MPEQAPNVAQSAIARPSLGRIVLVTDTGSNGPAEHPAIVNCVHSQDCINVMVFPDGGTPYSMTSLTASEDGSAQPQRWRWPPRV